uniref:Homologous recombination OB-fold protein OB-fold domain-containing protein n=1 Tax=Ananas comosus var. bracteatus TaxID=296719 RepID=A0A6V7QVN7_ANACO
MGDVEDDHRWEDAIDVDDSDLLLLPAHPPPPPPFLLSALLQTLTLTQPLPPSSTKTLPRRRRPASSPARRRVQASMRRRSSAPSAVAAPCVIGSRLEPQMRRDDPPSDLVDAEDGDFTLDPWLSAIDSLGEDHAASVRRIGSIKTSSIDRIPHFKKLGNQVVGVVKLCTPNGLGDLFSYSEGKDPTGMIGAFVHRKVISDGNLGGGISVGCVLILKQVVVFCPARSVCYLNVTINNIVKLFTKDCGPCHKQVISSFTARSHIAGKFLETHGNHLEEQSERDALMRRRIETGNACIEETSTSWACERMASRSKTAEVATTMAIKTSHLLQKLQDLLRGI